MDDKQRDWLASAIRFFVQAAQAGYVPVWREVTEYSVIRLSLSVTLNRECDWRESELDAAQIMALRTLVRDPNQLPQALADYLQELGVQPAEVGAVVFRKPEYDETRGYHQSWDDWQKIANDFTDEKHRETLEMQKKALGKGYSPLGRAFGKFREAWFGRRHIRYNTGPMWPHPEFLRERVKAFPTTANILRYLLEKYPSGPLSNNIRKCLRWLLKNGGR